MELTKEQKAIIEETVTNNNGTFGVNSVAGSGKSFTIFKAIDYIKEHEPNAKILYLVFNKANQVEAEKKLRKYMSWLQPVIVKTAHSYAYNKWMSAFGQFTAITALDWDIIKSVCKEAPYKYKPDVCYSKKKPFLWLHDLYCASPLILSTFCEKLKENWDDEYEGLNKPQNIRIKDSRGNLREKFGIPIDGYSYVSREHIDAFKDIMEAHEKAKLFTHGMYLKRAAYSKKTGGEHFDYVFFDEAQDANYFMLKLLEKQEINKLYFVGDERQSIYQFGNNVNVFIEKTFDKRYSLTTSFRFGSSIATLATRIIRMHTDHVVHGTEQEPEVNPNSKAILYRTNAKLFQDALDIAYSAKANHENLKLDLMKSTEDSNEIDELLSFLKLYYQSEKPAYLRENIQYFPTYVSPSLRNFEDALDRGEKFFDVYNELYDYLSDNIHSMFYYAQKETRFVEKYVAYQDALSNNDPNAETIALVTMHRSKGLEWDSVVIGEPTRLYYTDKDGVRRRNSEFMQELNLAYVAVTRARKTLNAEVLRSELSNERAIFDNYCYTIKGGKRAYKETLEQVDSYDDNEIDFRPTRNDLGCHTSDNYDDNDLCSKTYDPFWSKMLDASDVVDACDLC